MLKNVQKEVLVGIIAVLLGVVVYLYAVGNEGGVVSDSMATSTASNPIANFIESLKPTAAEKPASAPAPKTTSATAPLFRMAGSHQCNYEQVSPNGIRSTVVYFSGGKMRTEYRVKETGNTDSTIMLYNGGYLYTWPEGKSGGVKQRITSGSQLPAIIPQDIVQAMVIGTGLNSTSANCQTWIKDDTILTPPTYVTFNQI